MSAARIRRKRLKRIASEAGVSLPWIRPSPHSRRRIPKCDFKNRVAIVISMMWKAAQRRQELDWLYPDRIPALDGRLSTRLELPPVPWWVKLEADKTLFDPNVRGR
jgi:hypothetical protein